MNYVALKKRILSSISYNYVFLSGIFDIESNVYISLVEGPSKPFIVFAGGEASMEALFKFADVTLTKVNLSFDAIVDVVFTFYNASSFSVHVIDFININAVLNELVSEPFQTYLDEFIISEVNTVALDSNIIKPTPLNEKVNLYVNAIAYIYIPFIAFFEEVLSANASLQLKSSTKFMINFSESLNANAALTSANIMYMKVSSDINFDVIVSLKNVDITTFLAVLSGDTGACVSISITNKTNFKVNLSTLINTYFRLRNLSSKKFKVNLLGVDKSTMKFAFEIFTSLLRYDTERLIDIDNLSFNELDKEII